MNFKVAVYLPASKETREVLREVDLITDEFIYHFSNCTALNGMWSWKRKDGQMEDVRVIIIYSMTMRTFFRPKKNVIKIMLREVRQRLNVRYLGLEVDGKMELIL